MAKKDFNSAALTGIDALLLRPQTPAAAPQAAPVQPSADTAEQPQKATQQAPAQPAQKKKGRPVKEGKTETKSILLKIPADIAQQLTDTAWTRHTNTTALINQIIAEWLEDHAE